MLDGAPAEDGETVCHLAVSLTARRGSWTVNSFVSLHTLLLLEVQKAKGHPSICDWGQGLTEAGAGATFGTPPGKGMKPASVPHQASQYHTVSTTGYR